MGRKEVPQEDLPALLSELEEKGATKVRRSPARFDGIVEVTWEDSPQDVALRKAELKAWRGVAIVSFFVALVVAAVLAILMVACFTGGGDAGWSGTVEELPNGAVRVVNPPSGVWGAENRWRLVPALVLGALEGEEEEVFASVSGLEADDEGRIYVLDRQVNQLRIFSPEGVHLRSVGRTGSGPGEYQSANGLEWLSADSLLVIDQEGNRYSVLSKEGEYVRSVPRRLGFHSWAFRGGVVEGLVHERSGVRDGDDYLPAYLRNPIRGSGVGTAEGPPGDTVFLPVPGAPQSESFSVRTERGGMSMGVPFTPSSVYYLDREGTVWHGHGGEFRVFRSTLTGDTLTEIVLASDPTPVTEAELEEWEASAFVQQFRDMGGDLDMSRVPGVKPYFDNLYLDTGGFLWLSVPTAPGRAVFALVDPEGRYLGRLDIDGVERDVYVDPVVRNGRLYFVGQDELDVQRVYVYEIER